MVRYKILCLLLIVLICATSCGQRLSQKTIDDIKAELLTMNSYSCDVVMKVTNNRSTMEYEMKHLYKAPDKYRIENTSPEELKGQVIIYNGSKAYIYHPQINTYLRLDNFDDTLEHDSFIGAFIDYFKKLDRAKVQSCTVDGRKYYTLELKLLEDSRYLCREKLWMDVETAKPYKIEIYGKDNKVTIEILYSNYKRNVKLEDSIFEISNT